MKNVNYETIGKPIMKTIKTRINTEKFVVKEFNYDEIKNIQNKDRIETLKRFYPHIKVDWDRITPIINVCGYRPLNINEDAKSFKRPTFNSSGNITPVEIVALFGYSKRIHLYRYIQTEKNREVFRNGLFMEEGWEVLHVNCESLNQLERGSLEVAPIFLNRADEILNDYVERGKMSIRDKDVLITKYRKLSHKTTSIEELKELRNEFVKESGIILNDKESGFF